MPSCQPFDNSDGDMEEDHCPDDDSTMEPVTPIKSCSPSFVSAPTVDAFSAPPDWFKLSFDPAKNSKGFLRKKAPPQKVIHQLFSSSNLTVHNFWNKYFYGSPGKMPLKTLEETQGSSWHSDGKFKRLDGKKGTALKAGWSLQKPIYEYLEFLMISFTEEVALSMVQDVFDLFPYKHSKKPNLGKCKKELLGPAQGYFACVHRFPKTIRLRLKKILLHLKTFRLHPKIILVF
jgi:hypothetical protein